jgi:hypothetical protein
MSAEYGVALSITTAIVGALASGVVSFGITFWDRVNRPSWILTVVAETGSGPLGLWLLTRPNAKNRIAKFARDQMRHRGLHCELAQSIFAADRIQQAMIIRMLHETDQGLWAEFVKVLPDANRKTTNFQDLEIRRCVEDILTSHP